jgi:hypothetical protein
MVSRQPGQTVLSTQALKNCSHFVGQAKKNVMPGGARDLI